MKKPEELQFIRRVLDWGGSIPSQEWKNLTKRQYAYLEKWSAKDYWDSGVTTRSGWLTDKGRAEFKELMNRSSTPLTYDPSNIKKDGES